MTISNSADAELVDGINDLLGTDRGKLSGDVCDELVLKLQSKLQSLKDRFLVNLPYQYNDKREFVDIIKRLKGLRDKLEQVRDDQRKMQPSLTVNHTAAADDLFEQELKPLLIKSVFMQRKLAYVKCLGKLDGFRTQIESELELYESSLLARDSMIKSLSAAAAAAEKTTTTPTKTTSTTATAMINNSSSSSSSRQMVKSKSVEIDQILERACDAYAQLCHVCEAFSATECINLRAYTHDLLDYLSSRITRPLATELESCLKAAGYPFMPATAVKEALGAGVAAVLHSKEKKSSPEVKSQQDATAADATASASVWINTKEQNEAKMRTCATRLLRVARPAAGATTTTTTTAIPDRSANAVVQLFVRPLEKKFKFHFFGNRKTNDPNKPEWYLSQVLQWIKNHETFLNSILQPVFDQQAAFKHKSAFIEFSNALLALIGDKLACDAAGLVRSAVQFSHTIDELILFDAQLRAELRTHEQRHARSRVHTCLHLVCEQPKLFNQWLSLERQVCQKKVDVMFSALSRGTFGDALAADASDQRRRAIAAVSPQLSSSSSSASASRNNEISELWSCNYADVDALRPPHCAESFMLMIKAISDRYCNLPYPSRRVRFSALQLELLQDFHLRLCQIIRDEAKTPLSRNYLGTLNTVNYIMFVLDEWKNSPFFRVKYTQLLNKMQTAFSISDDTKQQQESHMIDTMASSGAGSADSQFLLSTAAFSEEFSQLFDSQMINNAESKSGGIFALGGSLLDMDGTLFDDVLSAYEKIKDDMINTITLYCRWEITSRSKFYKKEKWMAMPLFSEYYRPTLTQSAADMLISLRNLLHLLKESVARSLFDTVLKKITGELDRFLFEDVILPTNFNEGGVAQLDFDISKYLLPILNEFAADTNIDTYFKSTRESLILLKLKAGSAILLKDIISSALSHGDKASSSSDVYDDHNDDDHSEQTRNAVLLNARNAMKEFGLVQLTLAQARQVILLRTDFHELN